MMLRQPGSFDRHKGANKRAAQDSNRRNINWVHDRTATYGRRSPVALIGYGSVRTRLLADRADDAALGPRIVRRQLVFVREHFIVLRHRGYLTLRHHVHHLVAARLEL